MRQFIIHDDNALRPHKPEMLSEIEKNFPDKLSQGRFSIFLVTEEIDRAKMFFHELGSNLGYNIIDRSITSKNLSASGVKKVLVKDMDAEISTLSDFAEKYSCTFIACDYAQ